MKKILILLIVILCSCSKEIEVDPIIGKWKINRELRFGLDILDDCSRKITIRYAINGEKTIESYQTNSTGDCIHKTYGSGWQYRGDGWYEQLNGDYGFKVIFSNNNNTYTIPGNTGLSQADREKTFIEYIRIE